MSDHITLWLGERLEVSKITSSLKTQTTSSMNESSQNIKIPNQPQPTKPMFNKEKRIIFTQADFGVEEAFEREDQKFKLIPAYVCV